MDAQALTDELADAVKAHFGDAGLVLLVEALGILDGMTRLSLLWQLPASTAQQNAGGRHDHGWPTARNQHAIRPPAI